MEASKPKHKGRPRGTMKDGVIRSLSEEELKRFFKAARASKKWRLMFSLALHLGLRAKEVAELKLVDVDRENLSITVHGCKKGRTRHYSADELPAGIWRLVESWLRQRKAHRLNPYLFPSRLDPLGAMSVIGVQCAFKSVAKRAGIVGHSIHDLRHCCGQRLARMNYSALRISRWLRQQSSASAEAYVGAMEDKELGQRAAAEWPLY